MPREAHRQENELAQAVGRYFVWLGRALTGARVFGRYNLSGFSVRFDPVGTFVIIRAFDTEGWKAVVVFGHGDTFYEALRNATLAFEKGQWKEDKFAK